MNEPKLPKDGPILCAVSGGADSMCLLHLLWDRGYPVIAAHYEHGIRGEEGHRDAAFVENWCRERNIKCVIGHGDVPAYAGAHGLGVEEAARRLRYDFLENTAGECGCLYIATAHNAGDNAETVIFNLARGSGTLGFCGIPERRGAFIRPLLGVSREEIEQYLIAHAVPHVEDSTNESDDYSRNLIRHRVTPVLREINPALDEAIGRAARLLREDEDCLSALARRFLDENYDGESLPVKELAGLHRAVGSRVIREICGGGMSFAHVEAVLALLEGTELKYLDLPGRRIRREQGRLYFTQRESIKLPERRLVPGQWVQVPEAGVEVLEEYGSESKEIYGLFKTYRFKYENIGSNIYCTGRREGDRIRPLGRGCTKSLKSLFNEAGFTQAQRDKALVLRDEKGILAVYGLCVDERVKAGPGEPALLIKIREI